MFLSRVQNIKEALTSIPMAAAELSELPTPEDEEQWYAVVHLSFLPYTEVLRIQASCL